MGGGKAEGGKVDARSKAKAEVVATGKVVGGVVVGGNGRADLESIVPVHRNLTDLGKFSATANSRTAQTDGGNGAGSSSYAEETLQTRSHSEAVA